jgi:cytochrome c peroxidase
VRYRLAIAVILPLAFVFWWNRGVDAAPEGRTAAASARAPASSPAASSALAKLKALYRRPAKSDFPPDNPFSDAKATLGRKLFFDTALSGPRTHSCGTCHQQSLAWADGRARALGVNGQTLALRSPTLIDIWTVPVLGWDGKFPDLESVAFTPILSPGNMGMPSAEEAVRRINENPEYAPLFADAFDTPEVTQRKIELALATFERTITSPDAPFDAWIKGDERAIGRAAKRGFILFNGKANCAACHSGPSFTDGSFHDIGSATGGDVGRGRLFPTSEKLRYAFKVPTLREIDRRAPYMHDGSVASLQDVIALYDKGGIDRPSRSDDIRPLHLTRREKNDLLAFLRTLTAKPAASGRN